MKPKDERLLAKNGWTVECLSPFEIRHEETGSFASGLGANAVLLVLWHQKDAEREVFRQRANAKRENMRTH